MVEDELGLKSLEGIMRDLDTQTITGGGLVNGSASADKLVTEISNIINDIRSTDAMRALSSNVRDRRLKLTERFLRSAAEAHTKDPDDTSVLYAFKMLGTSSGNAIFRHCQDVILTLSSIGIKFKREVHSRISEMCRYGNLVVPPEVRSADPVSLRMIYYLFDEAEKKSLTGDRSI